MSTDTLTTHKTFWNRIDRTGGPDACWTWLGSLNRPNGYGALRHQGRNTSAHRVAWELTIGPIPPGMILDHLVCDNPRCANPTHMQMTTQRHNVLRAKNSAGARNAATTHCPNGHPYNEENTYHHHRAGRQCRTCRRNRQRQLKQKATA